MDTEHVAIALLAHDLAPLGVDATAWLSHFHLVWGLQCAGGYRAKGLPALAVDRVGISRRVHIAFDLAAEEAVANGHDEVEPRHVVVALLREGSGIAGATLHDMGLRVGHLRRAANLLPRPRVVAGGLAPPHGSEPAPSGPLVLLGGGPGSLAVEARLLEWTAARLGRASGWFRPVLLRADPNCLD